MAKPSTEHSVKLTKEDIRNGWNEETLKAYLKQRDEQKKEFASQKKPAVLKVENVKAFNPHDWR